MNDEYVFQLTGKRHIGWKYLRQEFLDDNTMTLEEAARAEFALMIEAGQQCWPDLMSVTMFGYKDGQCVGELARHEFAAV